MKLIITMVALFLSYTAYCQHKFEKINHIERYVYVNDTLCSHISVNTSGEWVPIQDTVISYYMSKNDTISSFDKYLIYFITFEDNKIVRLRLNKPFHPIDISLKMLNYNDNDATLDYTFWYKEGEYEIIIKGHDDW